MPKTTNNLWNDLIQFENLYRSFLKARRSKRYNNEVMRFALNLEENLINLQNHLIWGSWETGKEREFVIKETKRRIIHAPPFQDRIVHHALIGIVEPIFEKKFINDSYACRKNKGTQKSVIRTQFFLRNAKRLWGDEIYVLKADISRYFASIQHDFLLNEIKRSISDVNVIDLWKKIIKGYGYNSGVGLPVGALTSQLSANIVLNKLDHVVKDDLAIKFYVRYMDDFIIIAKNKKEAAIALKEVSFVINDIGLNLNPKTSIYPWQRGIDFCGYRIWPTHLLPRKRNIKRAKKKFKLMAKRYKRGEIDLNFVSQRVFSFLAYTKKCSANKTTEKILSEFVLTKK